MILPFKENFPWGGPTHFEEKILRGIGRELYPLKGSPLPGDLGVSPGPQTLQLKIHTIRGLNCRIQPGDKLHMAYGTRTKNYRQFNTGIPELGYCKSKQEITVQQKMIELGKWYYTALVDGKELSHLEICRLIENDGLLKSEFDLFFFRNTTTAFTGYIIHWTDFKY